MKRNGEYQGLVIRMRNAEIFLPSHVKYAFTIINPSYRDNYDKLDMNFICSSPTRSRKNWGYARSLVNLNISVIAALASLSRPGMIRLAGFDDNTSTVMRSSLSHRSFPDSVLAFMINSTSSLHLLTKLKLSISKRLFLKMME